MFKTNLDFAVILFSSLTWASFSQGFFTKEQVKNATTLIVTRYFQFTKPGFVPIAIRDLPHLNGFAVSLHGINSDLIQKAVPEAEQKYVVSIEAEGGPELYELRRGKKEYIVLLTEEEPVYKQVLKVKVTNGGNDFIEVVGLPVEGKFTSNWNDSTYLTFTIGGCGVEGRSDYIVFYRHKETASPDYTPPLDLASFVLFTQNSKHKLDSNGD